MNVVGHNYIRNQFELTMQPGLIETINKQLATLFAAKYGYAFEGDCRYVMKRVRLG